MFSVMTSISSVETPVDRRRFVFSSVFCSLLGFISDDYSLVVAFVVYLFKWIFTCIFRCTFRLSVDVSASLIFFCVNYCTCYILFIVACCFITAAGGRGVFVYFRQTACISYIITAFIIFNYYPPITASIGYLHLPARASIRVVLYIFLLAYIYLSTCYPFFRWLPV